MRKGSWWPRGIIVFFIALAAFESWFVYIAMTKHRSTVIEDKPYEAGLKFGEVIEGARAAKAAGVSLDLSIATDEVRGVVDGLALSPGWDLTLSVLRFNDPRLDTHREVTVSTSPFAVTIPPLKPGLYRVRAWLKRGEARYFFEEDEHVR